MGGMGGGPALVGWRSGLFAWKRGLTGLGRWSSRVGRWEEVGRRAGTARSRSARPWKGLRAALGGVKPEALRGTSPEGSGWL